MENDSAQQVVALLQCWQGRTAKVLVSGAEDWDFDLTPHLYKPVLEKIIFLQGGRREANKTIIHTLNICTH